MENQDYILLIMNCKTYLDKAVYQKTTWLQSIPSYLQFYHVLGDEGLESDFCFDDENRILWVKTPDDYNSLPKKVIAAYNAINKTFNFKYILKTDDDQMLINDRFFDILTNLLNRDDKNKIHYGGYVVDVKQNYLSQYHKIHPELPQYLPVLKTSYCSGRFYFLSNESINSLIEKRILIENEYLEDYAIGYNLENQFKSNILNLQTNNYFKDMEII